MTPDPETEKKVAQMAFYWLDYGNYGSEEKVINAFRKRKGMNKYDSQTIKAWLTKAVVVRNRLVGIKAEIETTHDIASHLHLSEEAFIKGTEVLTSRLNQEFPEQVITVKYMVSMAWCMYYRR